MIWPFKPTSEIIEALEYLTDVFRSKAGEQRIALRTAPRRIFNLAHILTDYEYSSARALIRENTSFHVPDWTQSVTLGAVSPATPYPVSNDMTGVDLATTDRAIVWQSSTEFEEVEILIDSNGFQLVTVTGTYTDARLMPLVAAYAKEGLGNSRGAAGLNEVSIAMYVYENDDLAATSYSQYRSHDIVTDCAVIGTGSFEESITWPLSEFDNKLGQPYYLRQRDIPDMAFQMRWHESTRGEAYTLRQWLHSRRGRQKAFWLSSRGEDLEPAVSISGTTVIVYDQAQMRTGSFDIEILAADGTSYNRQVTSVAAGTPVAGRSVTDLTIDGSVTVSLANITRISYLRCCRFDADRIELLHGAAAGVAVQVPCVEIPVP